MHLREAARTRVAPYATETIPLHLGSLTGLKYREIHCIECGRAVIERSGDNLYRIGASGMPSEVRMTGEAIEATCSGCTQSYSLQISLTIVYSRERPSVPLHLQAQTLVIAPAESKRTRLLYCMECGGAFHTVSDRITQLFDNAVPARLVAPDRLGPMEAQCRQSRCKQTWALMV